MKKIINVTDITGYLYCPRKIYLKLVKGLKSPPNQAMILGFLKHKVFDVFNKNEISIVSSINENLTKPEILDLYEQNIRKLILEIINNYSNMIYKFKISKEDLTQQTLEFFKKGLSIRADSIINTINLGYKGKELWRNLKPKFLTEFQIESEQLGLKGRIDRIEFQEIPIPYEIKTRDKIYYSDKIQLAAYSLLLEEEFGKKIEKGIIETKSSQEEIIITEELKNKVLELAEELRNMSEPEYQNNFSKCKNCEFKKQCFD
tara:strand:+ start:298 stop:1077 length:780 start_codon:yes stop_codon:yes gene_type:complete